MAIRIKSILFILLPLLFLIPSSLWAQQVLNQYKLKRFPRNQNLIYPYEEYGQGLDEIVVGRDPMLNLQDGSFILLWKRDWGPSYRRMLTCFDILLDTVWERHLDLDRNEEILHMYEGDTTIQLLSYTYNFVDATHRIFHRRVDLKTGIASDPDLWWITPGKYDRPVAWEQSPDKQYFLFYQFIPIKQDIRITNLFGYAGVDQRYRSIHSRVGGIHFSIKDKTGKSIRSDTMDVGMKKWFFLGAGMDNKLNVYASFFEKKTSLYVYQSPTQGSELKELVYDHYVEWPDLLDDYYAQLPLTIGENQRVYAPHTELRVSGRNRGLKRISIPCFDFAKEEVDTSRVASITSSLQVLTGKERTNFGLKPNKRFEEYVFRQILEQDDGRLLVWMQKQQKISQAPASPQSPQPRPYEGVREEWVLFEFNEEGNIQRALVVPTIQEIFSRMDQMSAQPPLRVDSEGRGIHMLTREASQDNLKGPERLYYRYVELATGAVSPRKLVYEGKRRNQYILDAFVEWINEDLISFIVMDGDQGAGYLVTVNISAEPEKEESK